MAKTEKPVYVVFGSHEVYSIAHPLIKSQGASNIIYTLENPKVEALSHDLIFLNGSDMHSGESLMSGGYNLCMLQDSSKVPLKDTKSEKFKETQSGLFVPSAMDLVSLDGSELSSGAYDSKRSGLQKEKMLDGREVAYYNLSLESIKKLINNPQKTIVFSHIPIRHIKPGAVDTAFFGESERGIIPSYKIKSAFGNLPFEELQKLAEKQGIKIKIENKGNQELRSFFDKVGLNKHITAHFHESVHKAHDLRCNEVKQGDFVNELFWNASYLDNLLMGILHVNQDGEVSFENLNLSA